MTAQANKTIHAILYLLPEQLREVVYDQLETVNDMHQEVYGRPVASVVKLDTDEFSESDLECLNCLKPQIIVKEQAAGRHLP